MMDFEEWFKSHRYSDVPLCYGAAKDAFEAGQQSKQEKIDEALAEIGRAMKCCESIETECVLNEIKEILK